MATAVNTTVTELPESRVSVDVEIAAEEIQRSLESQARKLGQEMKLPGFRTGKIPPGVVIQRLGRDSILDEAVRGRLTDWYLKAIQESGIAPVGDPALGPVAYPHRASAMELPQAPLSHHLQDSTHIADDVVTLADCCGDRGPRVRCCSSRPDRTR